MNRFWLVTAMTLLVLNSALLVLRALQPEAVVEVEPLPAAPAVPQVQMVADAFRRSSGSEPRCYSIGPLATPVQQSRAEDRLRPFANRIRLRTTHADRDRGWWVFVAAASRAAAIELAQRLAERGVEDYFVVADELLPDAVSLGLYEQADNARARLAQIRRLGFDAQMTVRREDIPQFWVDYQIDPGQRSPSSFILRSAPGSVQFEIPCF
ncbi:MAG: hypothetical protein ABR550_00600 [Wenzhouxiangellaceae bacterium]